MTRELIAVTNTTVVNTETMCELLRKIAALGLTGPITLVLDNARYQHNAAVKALGDAVGDHALVPAVVLAEPEPDRTPVEVHQAPRPLRSLPSDVRRLSSRHPRDPRRPSDHPRRATEDADDAQFPAIRRCLTHGRVRYNDEPSDGIKVYAGHVKGEREAFNQRDAAALEAVEHIEMLRVYPQRGTSY